MCPQIFLAAFFIIVKIGNNQNSNGYIKCYIHTVRYLAIKGRNEVLMHSPELIDLEKNLSKTIQ